MKPTNVLPLALAAGIGCAASAHAQDVRVFYEQVCPVSAASPRVSVESGVLAAILAGIAGKAIAGIVDNGVEALIKALKPDARTIAAQQNVQGFYMGKAINPDMKCLVVVLGDVVGPSKAKPELPFSGDFVRDRAVLEAFARKLPIDGAPRFYLEAAIVLSDDGSAIAWEPMYVYGGRFTIDSFFAGKSRDVALTAQLTDPAGGKIAELAFRFQDVAFPFERGKEAMQATAWSPMPSQEDGRAATSKGRDRLNLPFTVTATYVETPKPNQLTTILVGAVESQKETIKTAIVDEIDPWRRQKKATETAKASADASRKAVADYLAAWSSYASDCKGTLPDKAKLATCQLAYADLAAMKTAADEAKTAAALGQIKLDIPDLPEAPKG